MIGLREHNESNTHIKISNSFSAFDNYCCLEFEEHTVLIIETTKKKSKQNDEVTLTF